MIQELEESLAQMLVDRGVVSIDQVETAWNRAHAEEPHQPLFASLLELGFVDRPTLEGVLSEIAGFSAAMLRGETLTRAKKFTSAVQMFSRAIDSQPASEVAYWKRAAAYVEKRQWEEALADYETLVEMSKKKAEARNRRGFVLAKLGRIDDAIVDQEAAIAADPSSAKAHFNLGTCHHAKRELDRAIACYSRALDVKPDHIEALNNRAIACVALGRLEEAVRDWQRALEIDGQRTTVQFNLKSVLLRIRRHAQRPNG